MMQEFRRPENGLYKSSCDYVTRVGVHKKCQNVGTDYQNVNAKLTQWPRAKKRPPRFFESFLCADLRWGKRMRKNQPRSQWYWNGKCRPVTKESVFTEWTERSSGGQRAVARWLQSRVLIEMTAVLIVDSVSSLLSTTADQNFHARIDCWQIKQFIATAGANVGVFNWGVDSKSNFRADGNFRSTT